MRGEGGGLAETTYVRIGGTQGMPSAGVHLYDSGDFDIWKRN
jgi:hypothetical protein